MKIFLRNSSGFPCKININDGQLNKDFIIECDENLQEKEIELRQNEFDIYICLIYNLGDDLADCSADNRLKDKILNKLTKAASSVFDKLIFRVNCAYHISDISDGEMIEITSPVYLFGVYDILEFFELLPMEYVFPKLTLAGGSAKLTTAQGYDRRRFLKFSFKLGLICYGLTGLWKLPFQYYRVKHLSKDRVVFKKLKKFLSLSPEEQDKLLDKKTKMLEKY